MAKKNRAGGSTPCSSLAAASSFTEPLYLSSPRGTAAVWDARSIVSSPELGYDNDFISTPMPTFHWTQANVNVFSHIYLLLCVIISKMFICFGN
jgi:hypothetical protein